jgi:N-acetylglucosaminyl-diphospho-decaprenol L-rhamnosyltransferase
MLSVSIVSHRQAGLIALILDDLRSCLSQRDEVFVTLNVPEKFSFAPTEFPYQLRVAANESPKGFGANHNAAFHRSRGRFFCVLNPDIRIETNPFPVLTDWLTNDAQVAAAAPVITAPDGQVEDSARRFPTPSIILAKLLGRTRHPDYELRSDIVYPDWLAGMFIVFRRDAFEAVNGFDERYFLYYEDVDISARLALAGWRVALCTGARAVHAARRQSHRSLRYLRWHVSSMLRFFASSAYRGVRRGARAGARLVA